MGLDEYVSRKSIRSEKTAATYLGALRLWGRSLKAEPEVLVQKIKAGEMEPYDVLNNFISFLVKSGKSPKTTWTYYGALKDFLISEDVPLDAMKLKSKITLPARYEISTDRAPTHDEVKKIMLHSALQGKVVISMLASSGMRIGELASLRIGDIEFGNPTKIRVKARATKTKKARIVFISNEATEYLKEYLGTRIGRKEENIFINSRKEGHEPVGKDALYQAIMRKVDKAGLKEKMDFESARYAIHPHSLRKYFFTNALASGIDRGIVEGWMGHKFGLDGAYLRLGEEELAKEYLKAIDRFTFISGNGGQLRSRVEELEDENKQLRSELERLKSATVTSETLEQITKDINEAIAEGFRSGQIPKIKIEVKRRHQQT